MIESNQEVHALVERLVAIHGETGICPTANDWREILRGTTDEPLILLNLLKFKSVVETDAGPRTGGEAYRRYTAEVASAFARAGGERLFFGGIRHVFPLADRECWDAAILTRYPSASALAGFWLDDEFIGAHAHRVDGVERSRVIVMSA